MEDIHQRMPTLAEKIFKNLKNEDLIKYKESSREILLKPIPKDKKGTFQLIFELCDENEIHKNFTL